MSMAADAAGQVMGRRIWMTAIGALAGLAGWLLVDVLPDMVQSERLLLLLSAATGGFFACLLAAAGVLPLGRAVLAAAGAGLPAALLLTWASRRHAEIESFLQTGHALVAFALIVLLSLPFLIVALRPGESWRSYPALFRQSWDIAVRYAAAAIFTGAFWAVIFLSDALFGLVGLDVIQDLLDLDPVPPALTGAVVGLALAVVAELADYISPFLILRLMRLLLPVVAVVTAVFLAALPFRGLSDLFGGLSAAAVLLAMAVGVATLITSVVEREDAEATTSAALRAAAQLLALAVPLLTGLALYAVLIRVADYGWSPNRIAAACASAVGLGYGVLYAVAVIARRGWMERIRQSNIAMALAVIAISALWLTPVLNAERLSAQDQVARFRAGEVSAEDLDLWFLGRELGLAGTAALAGLAEGADGVLAERIARLDGADSPYRFDQADKAPDTAALRAAIVDRAAVLPRAGVLTPALLGAVSPSQLARWAEGCADRTPQDNPGCAALAVDLLPAVPGDEVLFFWRDGLSVNVSLLAPDRVSGLRMLKGDMSDMGPEVLDRVIAGDFALVPAQMQVLDLGTVQFLPVP